jgi:molybdopterin-guanine dinucleotide biosynthesis protein A
VAGIVLAGGASRRYGSDKALATVGGRPMVLRVRDALVEAGVGEVTVIGGDGPAIERLGCSWLPDRWPGEGPLGGLITGLASTSRPWAFVCACDLPDLDPGVLRAVLAARRQDALVIVPVSDGHQQTLTACYRRSLVSHLEQRWEAGERSLRGALVGVEVDVLAMPADTRSSFVDRDTPHGRDGELA